VHAALSNLIKLGFNSGKWQRRWVELQGAPDPMLFYYAEKTAGAEWFNGANCKNGTNKKEKGVCLCGVVGGGEGALHVPHVCTCVRAPPVGECVCVCVCVCVLWEDKASRRRRQLPVVRVAAMPLSWFGTAAA